MKYRNSNEDDGIDPKESSVIDADDDAGFVRPSNDFSDILEKVNKYKRSEKMSNKSSLYSTSDKDTSPSEWTKITVVNTVDWKEYFKNKRSLMTEEPADEAPDLGTQ